MRIRLALLLLATAVLLSGCGYWVVEDAPVQVGSAYADSCVRVLSPSSGIHSIK